MVISGNEFLQLAEKDPKTRFLAVVGNPVSHSRSPELHSFIYSTLGIQAKYFALSFETDKSLYDFLSDCERFPNITGFNITIPFKETVFRLYQPEKLKPIGSVNTLVKQSGHFLGENTDWVGFVDPIRKENVKSAVILGWGGAAKGVVFGLRKVWPECKITIISRKNQEEQDHINWVVSDYSGLSETLLPVDLIVNTTPLGMTGKSENFSDDFLNLLPETKLAYDIIYTPAETRFLSFFRTKSIKTQNGLSMFIGQALASHELWFGKLASTEKEKLMYSLSGLLQS